MLDAFDIDITDRPRAEDTTHPQADAATPAGLRHLRHGDVLFQVGDSRGILYRVERGSLCHYISWPDGRHEVIEFAFPGDIIGLGYTDSHISTAQAMVDSSVAAVPLAEFEELLAEDGPLAVRMAAAADREFEMLKQRAGAVPLRSPSARLAEFLLAIVAIETREGRSAPPTVSASALAMLDSGSAALTSEECETALADLVGRGAVVRAKGDIGIADLSELQRAAEAA
ncbi:MAG: Crp/Fnr family transcriptional regulator [Hyphomicrobium sp.]